MALRLPRISQADIVAFHNNHFSTSALKRFSADFFPSPSEAHSHEDHTEDHLSHEDYEEEWDGAYEDDDLGYYPDGVKRTLTDEQIEIFRHSELEALRRADEKAVKHRDDSAECFQSSRRAHVADTVNNHGDFSGQRDHDSGALVKTTDPNSHVDSGSEAGEIDDGSPPRQMTEAEAKRLKKKRARQRKREKNRMFDPEPKVDLRKRTWDVVDAGMDSLDYDELEHAGATDSGSASKRRQISYDD